MKLKIKYNHKFFSIAVFLIAIIPNLLIAVNEFKCAGVQFDTNFINLIFVAIVSFLFYKSKNAIISLKLNFGKYGFAAVFFLALLINSIMAYSSVTSSIYCSGDMPVSVAIFLANMVMTATLLVMAFLGYISSRFR